MRSFKSGQGSVSLSGGLGDGFSTKGKDLIKNLKEDAFINRFLDLS